MPFDLSESRAARLWNYQYEYQYQKLRIHIYLIMLLVPTVGLMAVVDVRYKNSFTHSPKVDKTFYAHFTKGDHSYESWLEPCL